MPVRRYPLALCVGMLLAALACKKESAPVSALPTDRITPSPVLTNQTVLQSTFVVKTSATFPFEVPAQAVRPHLHGIYESFAGELHGASDDSANLDFLLVNEEQQADLLQNRPSETLVSVEASHNQAVNFDLPPSLDHPVKYYLVFRNTSGSRSKKVVQANFRVDF